MRPLYAFQTTEVQLSQLQKRINALQAQLEEAVTGRTEAEVALRKAAAKVCMRVVRWVPTSIKSADLILWRVIIAGA